MVESHLDGTHCGHLGETQLRWFAKKLAHYEKHGWFRLGAVHHNVLRKADADEENLKDADDLTRWLGPKLNLLLHGHTHQARLDWLGRDLPVFSTGSAALIDDALPDAPNQYQLLRLSAGTVERWTRCYDPGGKRWIADTRLSENGNEWRTSHSITFHMADAALRLRRVQKIPESIQLESKGQKTLPSTAESEQNTSPRLFPQSARGRLASLVMWRGCVVLNRASWMSSSRISADCRPMSRCGNRQSPAPILFRSLTAAASYVLQ